MVPACRVCVAAQSGPIFVRPDVGQHCCNADWEALLTDYVKIEKGLGPERRIAVVRFDCGDGINALSPKRCGG